MKLFIAEKPALAKDIGNALSGSYSQGDGYFIKGDNIVTWCFGHLLEFKEPEDGRWVLENLPLPTPTEYMIKASASKQFKVVKELLAKKDVTEVIHCGDPDDEGQLLVDEILIHVGNKKPVKRLLIQDLSPDAIRKELGKMKSNDEYKNVYNSALARSQADWLVGLSLTRAFSIFAGKTVHVGRVQTPMLALVVNRDNEIANHVKSKIYPTNASFDVNGNMFNNVSLQGESITDKDTAQKIVDFVNANKNNVKIELKKTPKTVNPPLCYNLLSLQMDCAKEFGYNPDKVMSITQQLREKYKAITYNRSDCEYLPESSHEEAEATLGNLGSVLGEVLCELDYSLRSKVFNDKKITAHFAIIPTVSVSDNDVINMNTEEKNVFSLIANRYALQFLPNKEVEQYNFKFIVGEYVFTKTYTKVVKNGFDKEAKSDDETTFVDNVGESAVCKEINFREEDTKPKPAYTVPTFLKDLTSIAKYIKDENLKKAMLEKDKGKEGEHGGIGTPATRSAILKNLIDRGYLEEKGKKLISTALGRELISKSPKMLVDADLTAIWADKQKSIVEGSLTREDFINQTRKDITDIIESSKGSMQTMVTSDYKCPCGNGYLQRKQRKDKTAYFWVCNVCNTFYNEVKKNEPYIPKQCPQCKKGHLIPHQDKKDPKKTWYGCSEWKNGCKYTSR